MLITAVELVDDPTDNASLIPRLHRAEEMTGIRASLTLADASYHSEAALEECADRGQQMEMPESPKGRPLDHPYHKDRFTYDPDGDTCRCSQGQALSLMRSEFTRGTNKRMYQAPKSISQACPVVEVCITNGLRRQGLATSPYDTALRHHLAWMATSEARSDLKRRKQQGVRRFLLRGVGNITAEWSLLATAFNLRTLWRTRRSVSP